jgi:Fe2+ or Zn2+ uptake regulation protein
MTQMKLNENGVIQSGECESHHLYKISINGKMLICERCGRVKAIRADGNSNWEMLF